MIACLIPFLGLALHCAPADAASSGNRHEAAHLRPHIGRFLPGDLHDDRRGRAHPCPCGPPVVAHAIGKVRS